MYLLQNNMPNRKKMLIVADKYDICEMPYLNLENEGYNVDRAFSLEEALKKLTPDYDLILVYAKTALKIKKSSPPNSTAKKLIINDLSIEPSSKKVKIGNSTIPLTKIEFEILYMLASNPSTIYSRKQIIAAVWKGEVYVDWHTLDVHMSRLRKKLGSKAHCIIHRKGFGYEFNPNQ
jgi:DNA-binding response OmpR family regulator